MCLPFSAPHRKGEHMKKEHKTQEPAAISWEREGLLLALTQGDLQAIADLLDQKLEEKLEEKLEQKLEEKLDQKLDEKLDQKLDQKFKKELAPIYERLDHIDARLDNMDKRLDRADDNFKYLDVKLNKTIDKLESLDLSFRLFAQSTKKDIARLQDGMDTVTEVLRINKLIPDHA